MAYGTPQWLLGRNVTIQATPQDTSNTGQWSNNAIGTLTFNGVIDQSSQSAQMVVDNISPRDWFNSNPVAYEFSEVFTVTTVAQALPLVTGSSFDWTKGNVLEALWRVNAGPNRYVLLSVSALKPDNSSSVMTWTAYCLFMSKDFTSPKNKNSMTGVFHTAIVADVSTGVGQGNPSFGP